MKNKIFIVAVAVAFVILLVVLSLLKMEALLGALKVSSFTASFTMIGGFAIFLKREYKKSTIDFVLSMAAGVMLASSFLTLLAPAINAINFSNVGWFGVFSISISILIGYGIVKLLHYFCPINSGKSKTGSLSWIFIIAIAIHKIPEGLALGVATSGDGVLFSSTPLVLGIALQNIPEGMIVAIALVGLGYSRLKSALYSSLVGLMQPIGAVLGITITGFSKVLIPCGMALAGSCMIFVIISDMIPQRKCEEVISDNTKGIFIGFLVMAIMIMIIG